MKSSVSGLCLLLLVVLMAASAEAQRKPARTGGLRQAVYEKVLDVQELIDAGELDRAADRLEALQREKLSDYEAAQTWFLAGYVAYERGDYPGALAAYQRVAETRDLPLGMQQNVLMTMGQLYMVTEDYAAALEYIDRLLKISEEPQPTHYALKAQAHYRLEQMDTAEQAINEAMRLQEQRDLQPKENWLQLLNAIHYQRNDFASMLRVLQRMVSLYPRDRYLLNMAAIHGELGDSEKQLALMEPLYERGSLRTPSQKINLASLYMLHEIPYKAAALLQSEIASENVPETEQNLRMLGQAWTMAANIERSIEPLSRAAALSKDGELYVTLARTYASLLRWRDTESSLGKAFAKGGLKDPGGARLLLGMSLFNQKDYRGARRAFAAAGREPKTEKLAGQWLKYLEREEEKARLAEEAAAEAAAS